MDAKDSQPASSPQLSATQESKPETTSPSPSPSVASDSSGSKSSSGRGDASAVMQAVSSGQKTASHEHVAQVHRPEKTSKAQTSEHKLHKAANNSRTQGSTDSPKPLHGRNSIVTTFRVPAKDSPKSQHSRASTSQNPNKDASKGNNSSQSAGKDSKNHNKQQGGSHIPVKVSPKNSKTTAKTSPKESSSNTSTTPTQSDDLSPISDECNLVHAVRAEVSPISVLPGLQEQTQLEAQEASGGVSDTKSVSPSSAPLKDKSSPQSLMPTAQKEESHTPDAAKKSPQPTKAHHELKTSPTGPATHVLTSGSQQSATPKNKRQMTQTTIHLTDRQVAAQKDKNGEKKAKETEGKGGIKSKDAAKSVSTMTGPEGMGKDVAVQVSDDLTGNGSVVMGTAALANQITGGASASDGGVVMRTDKAPLRQRPSSQYVCQIEIELCSQSLTASGEAPPLAISGEGLRQEKVGPVQEVSWDEQGLTWEVYGAALDWQALGSAVQRHLQNQIAQLEGRLKNLQSTVAEKQKSAAPKKTKRKCRCWFHCSSCCCKRKQSSG